MRLFTGLDLPPQILAALENLLTALRSSADLRWSPVANLHVTTKFIGEWPETRLDQLKSALATLPGHAPVPIAIRGLELKPRLLWARVEAPALAALASDLDSALGKIGVPREQRPFNAHLTLARLGNRPLPLDSLKRKLVAVTADLGSFEADRFFLYLSKPGPGGSVYTKLAEFPFTK